MMKKNSKDKGIKIIDHQDYSGLLTGVSELLEQARHTAARSVNKILIITYWEIGRRIVEFEQKGKRRADYGRELLKKLSKDLIARFGRGFSERNLEQMRLFYVTWPISQTPSAKFLSSGPPISTREKSQTLSAKFIGVASEIFSLSWSHYIRLMAIDDKAKRDFYEEKARRAGWSVRQ